MVGIINVNRRFYHKDVTIGEIRSKIDGKLVCNTMERPYNQNLRDDPNTQENESSCINEGIYTCRYDYSQRFKRRMFRLVNVRGREGILIHTANHVGQLSGCIAPVLNIIQDFSYGDTIYSWWGMESKKAIVALEAYIAIIFPEYQNKEFTFGVVNIPKTCR